MIFLNSHRAWRPSPIRRLSFLRAVGRKLLTLLRDGSLSRGESVNSRFLCLWPAAMNSSAGMSTLCSANHLENDLAHGLPAFKQPVRLLRLGQRKNIVDAQLQPSFFNGAQNSFGTAKQVFARGNKILQATSGHAY